MMMRSVVFCGWFLTVGVFLSWVAVGDAGYGGGYPMLPWLTIPQQWSGQPSVLPNPPIYAQSVSADQAASYSAYRWEMFYDHGTTAAAQAADASATTESAVTGGLNPGVDTNPDGSAAIAPDVNGPGSGGGAASGGLKALASGGSGGDSNETVSSAPVPVDTTTQRTVFSVVNIDRSQRGGQPCKVSGPGNRIGVCVPAAKLSKECGGFSTKSPTCRFSQMCCIGKTALNTTG